MAAAKSDSEPVSRRGFFGRIQTDQGQLDASAKRGLLSANAEWSRRRGAELRRCYPEIHLRSLEEWLRDEGWQAGAARARAKKLIQDGHVI